MQCILQNTALISTHCTCPYVLYEFMCLRNGTNPSKFYLQNRCTSGCRGAMKRRCGLERAVGRGWTKSDECVCLTFGMLAEHNYE